MMVLLKLAPDGRSMLSQYCSLQSLSKLHAAVDKDVVTVPDGYPLVSGGR
jgi:5-deoxy-D-glucuronate isomerase